LKHAFTVLAVVVSLAVAGVTAWSPQPDQAAQGTTPLEVYHVHFNKAAPGQAAALGDRLRTFDPKAAMPGHLLVLRHQEGDDWDYCVIEHLGSKVTVDTAPSPLTPAVRDQSAWHNDTFAAGPAWTEFARAMGLEGASAGNPIYIVGVQRALPGHRDQLEQLLRSPGASKVPTGNVVLQHLEGGPWNFLTITRYNSWADLAADRAGATAATGTGPQWSDMRMHVASHHDTIADRLNVATATAQVR
jgi:hypothetical protein